MNGQHEQLQHHYTPRARDYLDSATHAAGADLDQIEAAVAARRPARVLDLGCGGGHVAYRAAPHAGTVTAVDLTAAMLELVAETAEARGLHNIGTWRAAAEALTFDDACFDMVLCRYSAHHWSDLEAGLREARRVLTDGGCAIFVDTVAPAVPLLDTHLQTLELLRDASHVRNYSLAEWTAALGRSGWRITGLTPRRIPMAFAGWVARTQTSEVRIAALLAVQQAACGPVQRYFQIEPDGSWWLDTVTVEAEPA